MRRKFIAAATSGVLALTVMAALPTHAEAVSIWLDLTPGTESVETFQYKDYADRYSDAYELYGYDAEALFNHYETVGKAEDRANHVRTFGNLLLHKEFGDDCYLLDRMVAVYELMRIVLPVAN